MQKSHKTQINIAIPDALLTQLKDAVRQEQSNMTAFVVRAIRNELRRIKETRT